MADSPGTDPVTSWLRAAITERLELARNADTGGGWEADKHYDALWTVDLQPSAGVVPDGMQWHDAQVTGLGDDFTYAAPRWLPAFVRHAQHIAANDPQDTIARCEAELAILGLYETALDKVQNPPRSTRPPAEGMILDGDYRITCGKLDALRPVIAHLASGYRQRPGYNPAWSPSPATTGSGHVTEYRKCFKPDCMRKVSLSSRYCCGACSTAAEAPAPYEIEPYRPDAHWILVHSEPCEKRAAERGECTFLEATLLAQRLPARPLQPRTGPHNPSP